MSSFLLVFFKNTQIKVGVVESIKFDQKLIPIAVLKMESNYTYTYVITLDEL